MPGNPGGKHLFGDPFRAVRKGDFRHQARRQDTAQNKLVPSRRESHDEIVGPAFGAADFCRSCCVVFQFDGGIRHTGGHLDRVDAIPCRKYQRGALRHNDAIIALTSAVRPVEREVAKVDNLLRIGRAVFEDEGPNIRDGQGGTIGEDEVFDRRSLVTANNRNPVLPVTDRDNEIAFDLTEGEHFLCDQIAENDAVNTACVDDGIATVSYAEAIFVVALAACQRIRPAAAGNHIVAIIETGKLFVSIGAGEHPVDHIFERKDRPVGKFETFDAGVGETSRDCQRIQPIAEADDEIAALAQEDNISRQHR